METRLTKISLLNNTYEIPIYTIDGFCKSVVTAMLESTKQDDQHLKEKFNMEYDGKYTRFNAYVDFCLHELGMKIYDPLFIGNEEMIASNGNRSYIVSKKTYEKPDFDIKTVTNTNVGQGKLTDVNVGYDASLSNIDGMVNGIVDSKGYVDASFTTSLSSLGELILMDELFSSEEVYNDYIQSKHLFKEPLEYITSKPNCIAVEKNPNGKIKLSYVSENEGNVKAFVDSLIVSDMLDENPIVVAPTSDLMEIKKVA